MRKFVLQILKGIRRGPDFVIGNPGSPYLLRWYVIPRNRLFNIYLHCILRSDDDRALHDHPWWNISWILDGGYLEIVPMRQSQPSFDDHFGRTVSRWHSPGSFIFRTGNFRHRLEVIKPTWTLFLTGPAYRQWGFHCKRGWVHYLDFVDHTNHGNVGKGCGE